MSIQAKRNNFVSSQQEKFSQFPGFQQILSPNNKNQIAQNNISQQNKNIDKYHPPNIGMKPRGLAPVAVNSIHSTFNQDNDFKDIRDKSVGRYNPNFKNQVNVNNIQDYSNALVVSDKESKVINTKYKNRNYKELNDSIPGIGESHNRGNSIQFPLAERSNNSAGGNRLIKFGNAASPTLQTQQKNGWFGQIQQTTNGMLPTLGLTKYKNVDLQEDRKNPFKININTEKLLVVRERQREFKDFNKLEKEGISVQDKEKASKPTRRGVIREIRNIKDHQHTQSAQLSGNYGQQRGSLPNNFEQGNQDALTSYNPTKKINIFELNEPDVIKKEKLAKLGQTGMAMVSTSANTYNNNKKNTFSQHMRNISYNRNDQLQLHSDAQSDGDKSLKIRHQSQNGLTPLFNNKQKALDYLQKGQESKETVKDYINFSRQILLAKININTKGEANERMMEALLMEQEKLQEGEKMLAEDKERFDKMMNESEEAAKIIADEVKIRAKEKINLTAQIEEFKQLIQQKQTQIDRIDDELQVCKQHKHFLDDIMVSKKQSNQKQDRQDFQTQGDFNQNDQKLKKQNNDSGLFMTQLNQAGNSPQNKMIQKQKGINKDIIQEKNQNQMNEIARTSSNTGSRGQGNSRKENERGQKQNAKDDSQWNIEDDGASYKSKIQESDHNYDENEFKRNFDKTQMIAYMKHLEDDSLFKIGLVQEDEISFDKMKQDALLEYQQMEQQIKIVQNNIEAFIQTKAQFQQKFKFLSEGSSKQSAALIQQNKKAWKKIAKTANKQKKQDEDQKNEKQTQGQDQEGDATKQFIIEKQQTENVKDLMAQYDPECNQQQLKKFFTLVQNVLNLFKIDDDPYFDLINALKKVEVTLQDNIEQRNHLHKHFLYLGLNKIHKIDIEKFENQLYKDHMEEKRKEKAAEDLRKMLALKDAQKKKAEIMNRTEVFKGKQDAARSQKKNFKPVVKKIDNQDPETKDEKEYLDTELFTIMQDVKNKIKKGEIHVDDGLQYFNH